MTRTVAGTKFPLMALVSPIYGMKHLKDRYSEKYLRQFLNGERSFASPEKYKTRPAKAKKLNERRKRESTR